MLGSIKEMIVVLTIAAMVFHFSRPIALQFTSSEDFSRRRLVWFILTAAFFLSPNFWLYALIAVPLLIWANRNDSNPVALYLLMLHVIPLVGIVIPILGNNGLFPLDNYRLLALCVLLPVAMRYRKGRDRSILDHLAVMVAMDYLLLAFGVLQVALYTPPDFPHHPVIPDSPSNALRRAFLFFLDTYLPYYTVSRTCQSRKKLVDAAATFCLALALLAALAMFEHARNWLLYTGATSRWAGSHGVAYLMRGGSVRAQTSAGHSIALGNILAIAFGLWLYLKSNVRGSKQRIVVTILLWGGLYATNSRGSWLGAAIVYFAFLANQPRALSGMLKGAAAALAIAGLVIVSPIGQKVLDLLPEMGKPADMYRHQLAERGWEIVFSHPLFGDQLPWPEMEDLRQGEGIIDIVNTYLGVGLNYGLVGLFLFLGFILLALMKVYGRARTAIQIDPDLALIGSSLIACIVGLLIMIDSNSFGLGVQKMFYVLAAFAAAYETLATSPQHRPDDSPAYTTRS